MDPGPVVDFGPTAMKTKGFTYIEIIVAMTLVVLLTSMATTSIYNVVHTLINIKNQNQNIQNIMAVHRAVAQAKMSYAADLALLSQPSNPYQQQAQYAITQWNQLAGQNNNSELIALLIDPGQSLPTLPLNPLTPGSRSYLPTSNTAKMILKYDKTTGNPIINYQVVPITDMDSLLRAFQLTVDMDPSKDILATITVGPMLNVTDGTHPTLPVVDWMSGTLQEIQF